MLFGPYLSRICQFNCAFGEYAYLDMIGIGSIYVCALVCIGQGIKTASVPFFPALRVVFVAANIQLPDPTRIFWVVPAFIQSCNVKEAPSGANEIPFRENSTPKNILFLIIQRGHL